MNQARKKVLYLITKATWGGAQRYVYDLATHLPKEKFDVAVAYGEKGKLSADLVVANIETRQLPSLARDVAVFSDIKSFFEIRACIRALRPDVIHLNSSKAAALGALAARFAGVPKIIFTVHGWPFKENRNVLARAMIRFVSWFTVVLSHSIIVVSKVDESLGQKMWFVGKKTHYIPIGIELPQFLSRKEARQFISTKIPHDGFRKPIMDGSASVVTVAELTANKGVRYAIEAIALLKVRGVNVSYFIISDGEERAALERLTREKNVADRVHFLGFVENAARYLKAFDVFLLPSVKEGMPYVLLEAVATNLPIITTNVVNPDLIGHYENIHTVPPANPQAIADVLTEVIREQPESELLPTKNPFPLSDMLQKTTALY